MKIKLFLSMLGFGLSLLCNVTPVLHKYRVYCQTEQANVYIWKNAADPEPTVCPNDSNHFINPNSISVVDELSPNTFQLQQEEVITGGHYCTQTYAFTIDAGPNVVTSGQISWPISISLLTLKFRTTVDHEGDIFSFYEKYDAGAITADIASGNTVLSVEQSVIDAVAIGYHVELDDGVNADDLGRITAIDLVNNTITVEIAAANSFLVSQNPVVRVQKKLVKKYEIGPSGNYSLLQNRSVGYHIPANTTLYLDYKNNSGFAKKLVFECEYLY